MGSIPPSLGLRILERNRHFPDDACLFHEIFSWGTIQMLARRWGGEGEREREFFGDAANCLRASYKRRV